MSLRFVRATGMMTGMAETEQLSLGLERQIYSVSRLNTEVRMLLEGTYPSLWVEGEISNFARPRSGHCYFTLKDGDAQVRCALFRPKSQYLRFAPKDGDHVLLRGRVSLYGARGDYQLIAEHMELAGDGVLQRAFEALKARLQAEGLFAPEHKRPLPAFPRRVGVITSPTGAAIRDVLTVLQRRFPALEVLIYPVPVQGPGAAEEIARTIALADARREVDLLLLTRGGGSLEDLWAFNEEVVARAVHRCELPLLAAVGHEVDFTIAEFVADERAPTPSAAAERISPDGALLRAQLSRLEQRLLQLARQSSQRCDERLRWLIRRLQQQHPGRRLQDGAQRLDELEQRLGLAASRRVRELKLRQEGLSARLQQCTPQQRVDLAREAQAEYSHRLAVAMRTLLAQHRQRLGAAARELEAVSPLATLSRGYAIVRAEGRPEVLRRADEVTPGDRITAKLGSGALSCRVESVQVDDPDD